MQEVVISERGTRLKIALNGEIDSKNADEFYETVMSEYRIKPCDIEFDCTALQFIDSTTLGTFVKILKHIKTDGCRMKLVGMQARLKKLFSICALDTIMEIS